jgi:hypothetical protein
VQFVKAALPAGELEFDGQVMHVEAPTAVEYVPPAQSEHLPSVMAEVAFDALYFPATHAVHVPPLGPVHPALQVQFVKDALPAGEVEFDGQAMHVELAVAPTAIE